MIIGGAILILAIIVGVSIQMTGFMVMNGGNGGPGTLPIDERIHRPLLVIQPEVSYDGEIELHWVIFYKYEPFTYKIYRKEVDVDGDFILDAYRLLPGTRMGVIDGIDYSDYIGSVHIISGLEDGIYEYKIQAVAVIDGVSYGSSFSAPKTVHLVGQEENVPMLFPIESPNIDGAVELRWNPVMWEGQTSLEIVEYRVYRSKDDGGWSRIADDIYVTEYTDNVISIGSGKYSYYIVSAFGSVYYGEPLVSDDSNIETVDVMLDDSENNNNGYTDPPSNPTIVINGGANETDSYEVTLTLSCIDAEEMRFSIDWDDYGGWIPYDTSHILNLPVLDHEYYEYVVGVQFQNVKGTSETVEDSIIFDIIEDEDEDEEPPVPPPDDDDDEPDYIWIYILIGVLVGVIGIVIFLSYRKRDVKKSKF